MIDANATESASMSRRLWGLVRAVRPRQWVKNLACFAGVIFSRQLFQWSADLRALGAFAGFSMAASAVYLLNDVCDRELDRANPSKRMRPIASGLVPVSWALGASVGLAGGAIALGLALAPLCAAIDAEFQEGKDLVEKFRAGQPSIFEKVRRRNAEDDSLSPG